MRYPKLRELKEAIKAIIKGPYTLKFPYKPCRVPERFRGKPKFSEKDCVGCGACAQVCPAKAIDFIDNIDNDTAKATRILTVNWDRCIFCGNCQANCLTERGITLTTEFDLATIRERKSLHQEIKKELLLCENCKNIIAPIDQISWVIKKIGPLYTSNTFLIAFAQTNLNLGEKILKTKKEFLRSERFSLLCPRCRREVVFIS
ncbi:MAG: 4Fe-4S dicluster domain-containing protein [Candidatus Omnitrophica bacterium]|nr:4Fe-4S dicluster domain-containing protein [Candidatus Omnitrophota bacterium]